MMKICSGKFKGHPLFAPSTPLTRPTSNLVRQALFNISQPLISGAGFLDVFAGSGAIGLEALSQGAIHTTFLEQNKEAISCIKKNIDKLKVEHQTTLIPGDALKTLKKLDKRHCQYNLIYADPPYYKQSSKETSLSLALNTLYIIDNSELLSAEGLFFLETAPEALPQEGLNLKKLKCKNCRRFGSTFLWQWQHTR